MASPFDVFRKPLTGLRFAPGAYVDGRWVEGVSSPLNLNASVQPATAEDLQTLEESRRQFTTYRIYTDILLKTVVEGEQGTNPDIIYYDGDEYEVTRVFPWQNRIIPHYKALITRRQPS